MKLKEHILPIIGILVLIFAFLFSFSYLPKIDSYIERHYGKPKMAENIKVTFPEGSTNEEMADILVSKMPNFNRALFLHFSSGKQGYLFPDTYLFYKNEQPESIVKKLENTFNKKVLPVLKEMSDEKYTEKQIIIMASIVEGESNGKEDASIVAGILWKRLNMGIPLQVDVAMETYKEKGLPVNPISNPGLLSIKATLEPTITPYLYYIHDKTGMIHLAKTFTEHKNNIKLYLK